MEENKTKSSANSKRLILQFAIVAHSSAWLHLSIQFMFQAMKKRGDKRQSCRSPTPTWNGNDCLTIFKTVFFPSLITYGHVSWVMSERVRSQVQASEMSFLLRIERVALLNKMRSSKIQKSVNFELLLLRIKRSQLRWFGHVSKMPQKRLPEQALLAKAKWRRLVMLDDLELDGPIT